MSAISLERDRIVNVLKDLNKKIVAMSFVKEDLSELLDDSNIAPNVVTAILKQMDAEGNFKKGPIDFDSQNAVAVMESTRQLCRCMLSQEDTLDHMEQSCGKRSSSILRVAQLVESLEENVEYSLGITSEQAKLRHEIMHDSATKVHEGEDDLQQLKYELVNLRRHHHFAMEEYTLVAQKLQDELATIQRTAHADAGMIDHTASEFKMNFLTDYEVSASKLSQHIESKTEINSSDSTEHGNAEEALRRSNRMTKRDSDAAMKKYDHKMLEYESAISEIQQKYHNEIMKMNQLQEYYVKIDKDLENKSKEESAIQAIKDEQLQAYNQLCFAASKIQALYRGVTTRRKLALKKKNKKRGKKGSKPSKNNKFKKK